MRHLWHNRVHPLQTGGAAGPGAVNVYAQYVEEAGGMVTIHNLQQHDNLEIYKKAFNIMDKYFPDDEEVDAGINAPTVDASGTFAVSTLSHDTQLHN